MSANHVLLQRIEIGANTPITIFKNIPQTGYSDLKVVVSARTDRTAAVTDGLLIKFNGSSTSYAGKYISGDGTSASSGTNPFGTSRIYAGEMDTNGATANTFSSLEIYISNYTSSSFKAIMADAVMEQNTTLAYTSVSGGAWSDTSAIKSIEFSFANSTNFVAGSSFSLYGIAELNAIPNSAPKAIGGDIITNDGEYWYHTFLSTSTFKPKTSLTCDYLLVAGAGGGGVDYGGGGGAGGYRTTIGSSPIILTPDLYTISVGAGGIGGTRSNGADGGNGTASSISSNALGSISAAGGGGGGSYNGTKNGKTGGSGGGGAGGYGGDTRGNGGAGNTPSTTPAQGTDGGYGYVPGGYESNRYGGGGGGATGSGGNATSGAFGQGGTGASSSISGTYSTYATGGKGCEGQSFSGAVSGAVNTGNGGQGGGENYAGGSGGSGIVIIRYAMA